MSFPMVVLGEVVRYIKDFIQIDDLENYKRCRVQLHAQGIVLRDIVLGAEIKTKKQQVCHTGEFLVAEIDAKIGGFGIVPPELDGAIVSSHYFLFVIDEKRLNRRFLDFFIRTPYFREQVTAQGSTNYAAIRPADVLGYKIPLPPLAEQRRIVARIEELAAKIEEARGLRKKAGEEAEALVYAESKKVFLVKRTTNDFIKLGEVAKRITKGESPEWQGFAYQDSGPIFVRSENVLWGKLDLSKTTHIPEEFHQKLSRSQLFKGDVLINLVGASIGRACVVPDTIGNANVNQAVAVISFDSEQLDSDYLMHFLLSPLTQDIIHGGKVETARPNISLGDLRELIIPLPPLPEQRRIVAYLDELQAKVDALRRLQAETGAEMDALLPAVLDRAFKGEL
ncbi:MAG: restriction endonuclease subunit S [Proteobacteria bacterium]|nr:restriction endonuclease subunit S [Pseudomonadota bacterium]MBU4140177.1 restriction endonuclease subunit S [Euryarchaeota archaeon]